MRLTRSAALLFLAACASQGEPPGSPPRLVPPVVILVSPDSGAVLPSFTGDAVIQFDEVVDEMASGAGGGVGSGGGIGGGGGMGAVSGIGRQVVLSPVAGPVAVSWHRSSIHVKPKEGWKPGRVYRLQLLPGIIDLHHNILKRGRTIIFSTGPAIPTASIRGMAVSWVEQRPLTQGLVRAVLRPDTVAYLTYTDSTGRFRLDGVPPGRYLVYAVNDQNSNRAVDQREAYDSVSVTLDSTASANLWAFVHDTTAPHLRSSDPLDSVSFRLTFTQPLATTGLPDTATVRLYELPDSTPVPLSAVLLPALNDSLVARLRAAADSARRAADTTHAAADTSKKPAGRDTTSRRPAAAPPPPSLPGHPGAAPAAPDSAMIKLLATRPVPTDKLVVRTAVPLKVSTKYYIRVRGATNLNGVHGDVVGVLAIPVPKKVAPDSSAKKSAPRVPADTARHR